MGLSAAARSTGLTRRSQLDQKDRNPPRGLFPFLPAQHGAPPSALGRPGPHTHGMAEHSEGSWRRRPPLGLGPSGGWGQGQAWTQQARKHEALAEGRARGTSRTSGQGSCLARRGHRRRAESWPPIRRVLQSLLGEGGDRVLWLQGTGGPQSSACC